MQTRHFSIGSAIALPVHSYRQAKNTSHVIIIQIINTFGPHSAIGRAPDS